MTEIIIKKEQHECAPAVAAYVKELDKYNKALLSDIAKKLEEIAELKAENERLEEKYQKATGVIATDSLPTAVDLYKLKKMCIENQGCRECAFRRENFEGFDRCAFEGLPMDWNFGGARMDLKDGESE